MWVPDRITPGETGLDARTVLFEIYTSDGLWADNSGGSPDPNYEAAWPTPASGDIKISYDLGATWSNGTIANLTLQSKEAKYVFTTGEVDTSHSTSGSSGGTPVAIGLKFEKTNHRTQIFFIPFAAATSTSSSSSSSTLGSGASFYKTASSRSITTGTGSGGAANTVGYDQTYDNVASATSAIDFYYQFDLSGHTGAVGAVVDWNGYLDDPTNAASLKVEAYNWGSSSWDQIGTVPAAPSAVEISLPFKVSIDHTGTGGNLGLVRIRFHNTGISATMKTDRILLGCGLLIDLLALESDLLLVKAKTDNLPTDPADESNTQGRFNTVDATLATITGYIDTEVADIKAKTDQLSFSSGYVNAFTQIIATSAIDLDNFTSICFRGLSGSTDYGMFAVDAGQPITQTAMRLDAGAGADNALTDGVALVMDGTGQGWFATVSTYDDATGDTVFKGNGFPGLLDGTSKIRMYAAAAGAVGTPDVNVVSMNDNVLTAAKFTDAARRRLFHEVYEGEVDSFGDAQVVLSAGTFGDGQLRNCALHVWTGLGVGQTWLIAWNDGSNGRTLTLAGGDSWPVAIDPGIDGSRVIIFPCPDAFGTLFDRGGTSMTSGRQQLNMLSDVHASDGSINVGQPDTASPAVYVDETGADVLSAEIDVDGNKATTWTKSKP